MRYAWVSVGLVVVGCSGTSGPGIGEASTDGGQDAPDAAPNAGGGHEAGAPGPDAGTDSPAGDDACVPTCPDGVQCGVAPDGCGGTRQCGTCMAPDTCGGGGKPNVCGCTPAICVSGQTCSVIPNNCGGSEDCGECPATDLCVGTSCNPFSGLGCQPTAADCSQVMGSDLCVRLVHNGGMRVATYDCPTSAIATLMQVPCQQNMNTPTWWNCCTEYPSKC